VTNLNELKARLEKCVADLDNLIQTMTKEVQGAENDGEEFLPEVPC
jgi:t-SNARE complex subunit (syntaxin)